jgi:metal-responsive CopG/Arc/MetJ family transcriptional regulator
MSTNQQKVTVTLPKPLLERLNETIPSRRRSLFITEAIEEHLDLIEQSSALIEAQGAWSLHHHPDMKDDKDIDTWLKDSRQSWG